MPIRVRRLQSLCRLIVFGAASFLAQRARADAFVNFDNLDPDTPVEYQYAVSGVQFNGNPSSLGGGATTYKGVVTPHSAPNVLMNASVHSEFAGGPLTGTFTTAQQTVTLYGGYYKLDSDPKVRMGTLRGFDQAGNVVASDGPRRVLANSTSTQFAINAQGATISSFALDFGAGVYTFIDDLQFSGGAPMTPPSGPPVVQLLDPEDGSTLDLTASPLHVLGAVAGDGVLPNVTVELRSLVHRPFEDPPPVQTASLKLFPVIDAFEGNLFPNLLMGSYSVTVTATNNVGQTGSATVSFINMPASLAGQSGFLYAVSGGACQIARFKEHDLAYWPATGQQISMPEAITDKWIRVRDYTILRHDGRLGCPTGQASTSNAFPPPQSFPPAPQLQVQDFERGRIYALGGQDAHYTPKVLVDAITAISTYSDATGSGLEFFNDTLGTIEVGIPVADPVGYLDTHDPTWLFQRFARIGFTGTPNTLEIRGQNPNPTLYIERVGGSMVDFRAAMGHLPTGASDDITPTVWDSFPCHYDAPSQVLTCAVTRPPLLAISDGGNPLYTTSSRIQDADFFCDVAAPFCTQNGDCPQWSAVPGKGQGYQAQKAESSESDFINIQALGFVMSSNAAGSDLSIDHRHMHRGPAAAWCDEWLGGTITVVGCIVDLNCDEGRSGADDVCGGWSDWGYHIRPLAQSIPDPNQQFLRLPDATPSPPFWSLLASTAEPGNDVHVNDTAWDNNQGSTGDLEVEWEYDWSSNLLNVDGMSMPHPGALAFSNGRWIIDCGHVVKAGTFWHSEIHPLNTLITSESSAAPAEAAPLGLLSPVTKAQVWVNKFFGGNAFQAKIWPPPRPTPQAQLNAYFQNFGVPAGGTTQADDGSWSFSFTNYDSSNRRTEELPPDASSAQVTFGKDGLVVWFSGPFGRHVVFSNGQAIYPNDGRWDGGGGVHGEFIGRWYVGWTSQ